MNSEAVEIAIGSFRMTRAQAEAEMQNLQPKVEDHHHGRLCFRWRGCRSDKSRLEFVTGKIRGYLEAEEGLSNGQYTKAIDTLISDAQTINVRLKEKAFREAMAGNLPFMRLSEHIMVQRMVRLASDLQALTPNQPSNP